MTSKSGDRANKCEIAIIDIISESQSASMQLRYNLCNLFFHFIILEVHWQLGLLVSSSCYVLSHLQRRQSRHEQESLRQRRVQSSLNFPKISFNGIKVSIQYVSLYRDLLTCKSHVSSPSLSGSFSYFWILV